MSDRFWRNTLTWKMISVAHVLGGPIRSCLQEQGMRPCTSRCKQELRDCFFCLAFSSVHISIANAQLGKVTKPEKRVRGHYHLTYYSLLAGDSQCLRGQVPFVYGSLCLADLCLPQRDHENWQKWQGKSTETKLTFGSILPKPGLLRSRFCPPS